MVAIRGWLVLGCVLAAPASAQTLKLRPLSPVASLHLAASLGVPEDSLRPAGRGVWYHDVQPGAGEPAAAGDEVAVHFVGFLVDGTKFTATTTQPFRFVLGADKVIAGWEDGVAGMRVGGRRQLVVPALLGYGAKGSGPVPPNADLVFDITLVAATHSENR